MKKFVVLLFSFATTAFAQEKILTFCPEAPPQSFNAQLATDGTTFNASSRPMYNRLVDFERGTTRVVPSLAKSWSVSPDGKKITFQLRNDVEFHTTDYFKPTRKFNAEDVLFSMGRMRDTKHPFHNVGGGKYPAYEAQQMSQTIQDIVMLNDYSIQFILRRPEAPFLANMAMDFASILSKEYGDQLVKQGRKENIDKLPVGTGPFVFKWYERDQSIRYVKHPNYFLGPAKIDQLVFSITPDPVLRLDKLKKGLCHLSAAPSASDVAEVKDLSHLRVMSQPGLNIAYLAMNVEKEPFNNQDVRRAIHHALNRSLYAKSIYAGNAQVAKNPIPPTMWSYAKDTVDYGYDPVAAKKYLVQAGFPKGFSTELWYTDTARPYNPNPKKMAEMMANDMRAVGIQVKLVQYPWKEFLDRSKKGEPSLSLQGWTSDNGDPDNFLNNLLSCNSISSGNNRARWCDKNFSFQVDRARVTTDLHTRTKFYEEAQKIFKQQIPWVTLVHGTVFKIISKDVKDYRISPFGVDQFYYVDLEKQKVRADDQ